MWTLTKLFIAGTVALFWLQSSTPDLGGTTGASTTSASKAAADAGTAVGSTQPVITVHGVCAEVNDNTPSEASPCVTMITRERFETLQHALHPGSEMPAEARNNLGKLYAQYLIVEAATRNAGMEGTAEFRELTNWMRAVAASEYYRRKLQEKYSNPSQQEVDAYYQQHLADYETVKLVRVLIPRENTAAANAVEFEKKALEAARTAQASLVKGMDATEIQNSVYTSLGLQGPPAVDLGTQRRKNLLPHEATEVFSLKSGEVTQVQTEDTSYVVYKVLSRETPSEESLRKSIAAQITEQKFTDSMNAILSSASIDLNQKYFQAPGPADAQPPRNPHIRPSN